METLPLDKLIDVSITVAVLVWLVWYFMRREDRFRDEKDALLQKLLFLQETTINTLKDLNFHVQSQAVKNDEQTRELRENRKAVYETHEKTITAIRESTRP